MSSFAESGAGLSIGQQASMKKISEYRLHAEECRLRAQRADSPEHGGMLLTMAATWDALADGRKRNLAKLGSGETKEGGKAGPAGRPAERLDGGAAAAGNNSQARAEGENVG
jgi:hypothetical protein